MARGALELLPETDATSLERASARAHVALTFLVSGDVHPADERPFEEAIAAFTATRALLPLLNNINRLGRFQMLQGRLRAACATYQRAAEAVSGGAGLPVAAVNSSAYYVGLGDIHHQWNDLDSAERYLRRAVDLVTGALAVDAHVVTDGYLSLARLHRARGQAAEARATLEEFADLARQREFFSLLVERGEAEQARLALTQHDLAAAVRWVEATELDERKPPVSSRGAAPHLGPSAHRPDDRPGHRSPGRRSGAPRPSVDRGRSCRADEQRHRGSGSTRVGSPGSTRTGGCRRGARAGP